jgi:acyl carrier protein
MTLTAERFRDFLRGQLEEPARLLGIPLDDLEPDFDLVGSGAVDSMRFVELLGSIEQEFGLQIDLDGVDIEKVTRVGGLTEVVLAAARRNG